jgi:hypothetical protein
VVSREKDRIGRLFAQLTGQLEDAAEVATNGQNPKLSVAARSTLALRVRRRLTRTWGTVSSIENAIANLDGGADN